MVITKNSSIADAILETAGDLHRHGLLDKEEYCKITNRHLDVEVLSTAKPMQGEEIRSLRERAHMSQAAFARTLNLSTGTISQLNAAPSNPKAQPSPCSTASAARGLRRYYNRWALSAQSYAKCKTC